MNDEQTQTPSRLIPVWDLPVRIFHWALVLLVIFQVTTAQIGGNALEYHALGGYTILALVLFRLAWGFAGGRHARFADFLRGPGAVWRYLRGRAGQNPGHSPLGGWSVVLMLASLLTQAATGLFASDDVMMEGPLAKHVSGDAVSLATLVHDVNAVALLTLITIHLLAVLFYLFARKRNLIMPMLTGGKRIDNDLPPMRPDVPPGGNLLVAAGLFGAAAAVVYLIVNA